MYTLLARIQRPCRTAFCPKGTGRARRWRPTGRRGAPTPRRAPPRRQGGWPRLTPCTRGPAKPEGTSAAAVTSPAPAKLARASITWKTGVRSGARPGWIASSTAPGGGALVGVRVQRGRIPACEAPVAATSVVGGGDLAAIEHRPRRAEGRRFLRLGGPKREPPRRLHAQRPRGFVRADPFSGSSQI